jgi:hypothetical protein
MAEQTVRIKSAEVEQKNARRPSKSQTKNARWSSKKMHDRRAKAEQKNVRRTSKKCAMFRAKAKQKMREGRAKNARWEVVGH